MNDVGYEKDFYAWTCKQAYALKNHDVARLDFKNLLEEIECLGISDKRALRSQLVVLIIHLLKVKYQTEKRTNSWDESIRNSKIQIELIILDSPSLKRFLYEVIDSAYDLAVRKASSETGICESVFPSNMPWPIEDLFPFLIVR